MPAIWRLTWKVTRFEITALAVLASALTVAALILAGRLDQLAQAACLPTGSSDATHACDDPSSFYALAEFGRKLMAGLAVLPVAAGAVLGSQLVAREVEQGTAQLAWSFAPSRRRWFLQRSLVLGLVVVVLLVPLALSGDLLERSIEPGVDPNASLLDLGLRGPGLVMRGVSIFAAGLALGAVLGRVLPALLAAAVPAAALLALGTYLAIAGQPAEIIGPLGQPEITRSIVFEDRFRGPDGELLTMEQAFASAPAGTDAETWAFTHFSRVAIGIPGYRFPEVERRSAVLLGAASLALWLVAMLVVERRRPY